MRRFRPLPLLLGLLLVAALVRHPTADIRVITHDPADLAPHHVRAALDLGVMAVNVLVTWTTHRLG